MMTSSEIRQSYLDFFVQKHGHTFVPSSPVVPHDDPTLLFTNAGMNQFKPIFLGQEKRAYTRAANTQKCIRAGGKHNDLDDVGRSRRHHTFFEMLGNWSFGDYFKQGAIEMSWELLTQVFKLDPRRLHVTCFEGDEKNGVPRDTEAAEIWKQVAGLPDDHIHFFGKDNFWEMGDTGPCGPCTEIFYDRTDDFSGGQHVNGEDPRVMEIWNNVFIQYNRNADRTLTDLPAQHVDTGMGFERMCQVMQNVGSNYDIDLFHPFWAKLKELSGFDYSGKFPPTNAADPVAEAADEQLRHDIAMRVIADHVRCLTFAITDGAVPSNEGRGYVLRRILRRAVRFGRQQLGLRDPFLYQMVQVVVDAMGDAFPELRKNPQRFVQIVKDEEKSFGKTLDRGLMLFDEVVISLVLSELTLLFTNASAIGLVVTFGKNPTPGADITCPVVGDYVSIIKSNGDVIFQGEVSAVPPALLSKLTGRVFSLQSSETFKLHDTYGFPIDLTRIMAEERGLTVDLAGFEKLMEEARELARSGGKTTDNKLTELTPDTLEKLRHDDVVPTDDSAKFSATAITATVKAIYDGQHLVRSLDEGTDLQAAVILERTNFYAEMGGQVGDSGELKSDGGLFEVESTKTAGPYVLHIGEVAEGRLRVGDTVTLKVSPRRAYTQRNHTSTHLANWALRETLGDEVNQKGSLVDPEKLRFDFTHGKLLSDGELAKVERLVMTAIGNSLPVYTEEVPQEQALKINGLRAVFGEKYPPKVRVVSIGAPVADLIADPTNEKWRNYSVEFCGGTHIASTADAGAFVVTADESVSKGVRRIVALTGEAARATRANSDQIDAQIVSAMKLPDFDLAQPLAALQQALTGGPISLAAKRRGQAAVVALQAKIKAAGKAAKVSGGGIDVSVLSEALLSSALHLGGGKVVVGEVPEATDEQLRSVIDSLRKKQPSLGVLVASSTGPGKISFITAVSDDLIVKGLKAGDWVKVAAQVAGGGGGGRPQMAQAGGKDPTKMSAALDAARAAAAAALG